MTWDEGGKKKDQARFIIKTKAGPFYFSYGETQRMLELELKLKVVVYF